MTINKIFLKLIRKIREDAPQVDTFLHPEIWRDRKSDRRDVYGK